MTRKGSRHRTGPPFRPQPFRFPTVRGTSLAVPQRLNRARLHNRKRCDDDLMTLVQASSASAHQTTAADVSQCVQQGASVVRIWPDSDQQKCSLSDRYWEVSGPNSSMQEYAPCLPRTARRKKPRPEKICANLRKCRAFANAGKRRRRDRTGWLGRRGFEPENVARCFGRSDGTTQGGGRLASPAPVGAAERTGSYLHRSLPTTFRSTGMRPRYTGPNADQKLLVKQLKLDLLSPPRMTAPGGQAEACRDRPSVVETFGEPALILFTFPPQSASCSTPNITASCVEVIIPRQSRGL
jgi:hypothetical protein